MMLWAIFGGVLLLWWSHGASRAVSPDGTFYLRMARGEAVPSPYGLRWGLPRLLGPDLEVWVAARAVWLVLLALLFGLWCAVHRVDPLLGIALLLTLPIVRTSWMFPVLVDLPGLVGMLAVAIGASGGAPWWMGAGLGLLAALLHERAAPMGAFLADSPWPLAGFAVTAWRWWVNPAPLPQAPTWLRFPFREARKEARLDLATLVLPWGVGLLAAGASWTPWEIGFVALAYLPLVIAQDHARVYQWAFPVVLAKALQVLPGEWGLVAVVVAWLWPWRRAL